MSEELDSTLSKDDVHELATRVYKEIPKTEYGWPDCFDVSVAIRDALGEEYGVPEEFMRVEEYMLDGEYGHYVLIVGAEVTGYTLVVDASFEQFAEETETPFSIAPQSEMDSVVVTKQGRYIFHNNSGF